MALNVVMLGAPGAGKGTQAEALAGACGVPKISTGDILREAIGAGTELGRQAKATVEAGRLVSDEVMIGIVRERLQRDDTAGGFVLDGFPRTVAQAEALDGFLQGRGPLAVVEIRVPEHELVRRLTTRRVCGRCGANAPPGAPPDAACPRCGGAFVQRRDDSETTVRERLRVFECSTRPLMEYYRARPTYLTIDGSRRPEVIQADLRSALESLLPVAARRPGTGGAGPLA
jgi:adenylate kinase